MAWPRFFVEWNNRARFVVALLLIPLVVFPFAVGYVLVWLRLPSPLSFEISRDVALIALVASVWLLFRAIGPLRFVVALAALIAVTWIQATVIWRDAEYWRVVDDYKHATRVAKQVEPLSKGGHGWTNEIALSNGVTIHLDAGDHMDIARLRYSDESAPRDVFQYEDYTNVEDVRNNATTVYILRDIILLRVEVRLTAYDLERRAVIADRRIDRNDLK